MSTFLFAWNPRRWQWDDINNYADAIKNGERPKCRWSSGTSRQMKAGDRAFIIRLGEEPKGIFASGSIVREPFYDAHWDKYRAQFGERAIFVEIELDTLQIPGEDPILPRELLISSWMFSDTHWDIQASGVRIQDITSRHLEKIWQEFHPIFLPKIPEEINEEKIFWEGAKQKITINAYERNAEARRRCIEHFGENCLVCGFSFLEVYGKDGKGIIHIHHLRKISEIGEGYVVDPINDLIPVCPNCHAIIHKKEPPFTPNEVQVLMEIQKKN